LEKKLFDKEAINGYVTHLAASGNLLVVGYSNGVVIVYDLLEKGEAEAFEQIHKFHIHRSPITALVILADGT
jgi:hypothetical protein